MRFDITIKLAQVVDAGVGRVLGASGQAVACIKLLQTHYSRIIQPITDADPTQVPLYLLAVVHGSTAYSFIDISPGLRAL